jgi:hypothetical protein
MVNTDFSMLHMGIIYLPSTYITSPSNSNDQSLPHTQNNLKIVNMLAKQLVKHWFYNFFDLHCDKSNLYDDNNYDITTDTLNILKNVCQKTNAKNCLNMQFFSKKGVNEYLEINEKCFLYKGFVSWIGYLAFQAVQPGFIDLVRRFYLKKK